MTVESLFKAFNLADFKGYKSNTSRDKAIGYADATVHFVKEIDRILASSDNPEEIVKRLKSFHKKRTTFLKGALKVALHNYLPIVI